VRKVTVTLPGWIGTTTFTRFQRRVTKRAQENFTAWDDLMEWEACYRAYQEWKKRHTELRRWSGT
jgi:hypothetical protein